MNRFGRAFALGGTIVAAVAVLAGLLIGCGAVRQNSAFKQCAPDTPLFDAGAYVAAGLGGAVCSLPPERIGHLESSDGRFRATLDYDIDRRGWIRNTELRLTDSGNLVFASKHVFDERIARARSATPQGFLVVRDATIHLVRLSDRGRPDVLIDFFSAKRLPILLRNPDVLDTIRKTGRTADEYAAFIEGLYVRMHGHPLPALDESPYSVLFGAEGASGSYHSITDAVPRDEFFVEPPAIVTAPDGRQGLLVHRYEGDRTQMRSIVLRRDGDKLVERTSLFRQALRYEAGAAFRALDGAHSWPAPRGPFYDHYARTGFVDDDDEEILPWVYLADNIAGGDPEAAWTRLVDHYTHAANGWHWGRANFPSSRGEPLGGDGYRFLIVSGIYYRYRLEVGERAYGPHDPRLVVPLVRLARIYLQNIALREDQIVRTEQLLERLMPFVRSGAYPSDACPAAVLLDDDYVRLRLGRGDAAQRRLLELDRRLRNTDPHCPKDELFKAIMASAGVRSDEGAYEPARILIEHALALRPDDEATRDLAELYEVEGDPARALALLDAHRLRAPAAEQAAWTASIVTVLLHPDPLPNERRRILQIFDELRPRLGTRRQDDLALFAGVAGYLRTHAAEFAPYERADVRRFLERKPDLAAYGELLAERSERMPTLAAAQAFYADGQYARGDAILASVGESGMAVHDVVAAASVARGRTARAQTEFEQLFAMLFEQLETSFPFMSEPQRLRFIDQSRDYFNRYYSFAVANARDPAVARFTYDLLLRKKAIVGRGIAEVRATVAHGSDPQAQRLLDRISILQAWYAKLSVSPRTPAQEADFRTLPERIAGLERELNVRLVGDTTARQASADHWPDVRARLAQGDAAVEIASYAVYDGGRFTGRTAYAAAVLRAGRDPALLDLGGGPEMEAAVRSALGDVSTFGAERSPERLYAAVWSRLAPALQGVRRVFLSPDGVLNELPFDMVQVPGGGYLGDRFDIRIVTSTSSVAGDAPAQHGPKTAELFADPAFGLQHAGHARGGLTGTVALAPLLRAGMRFTRGADIPALPGARQEAGDVARELNASGWDVLHRYVGAEALEEVVKAERSPRVLHIATHGFFFEAGQYAGSTISGRFSALDDPMMRSGLLFAGAQRVWRGDPPAPGIEDGVLTAKEASTIDLVGTELVVLSACDTGLGDIHDGEGVFGLRRAFQEAGATYVLMSMWEVDDRSTRALMSAFYGHWLHDGMEIHAALRTAESEVRAEIVRENGGRDLQRYWAPFVLAS